jgi:serine/threonine protein kinase
VVKFYGAAARGREVYLVTEFMAGGSLSSVLAAPLPWRRRVSLLRGVAEGLAHLHAAELLHRDIKADNILLDDAWRPVIADYGFAKKVADLRGGSKAAMTILGTEAYMAPEVAFGEPYGEGADVFSLGCVMAAVIARRAPGEGGFLERHPRHRFAADVGEIRAAAPPDAPPSLIECAAQCLAYEPDARISAEQAADWLRALEEEMDPEADDMAAIRPSEIRAAAAAAAAAAAPQHRGGSAEER